MVWIQFSLFSADCKTKIKEHSLSYYLFIAGEIIVEFILNISI